MRAEDEDDGVERERRARRKLTDTGERVTIDS